MLKELEQAFDALGQYQHEKSLFCFKTVLLDREVFRDNPRNRSVYITSSLKFADLALLLGKELETAVDFLETGLRIAEQLGDQRNHILIQLTLGHVLLVEFQHRRGFIALSEGTKRAEALGDADILNQASQYFGLYYFIQGRHREALVHSEQSLKDLYNPGVKLYKALPLFVAGLSAAYIGQFHQSIGLLDFHCHFARQNPYFLNTSGVLIPRAALGMVLEVMDKKNESLFHLEQSHKESLEHGNMLGLIFALRGLAFHYYKKGNIVKAVELARRIAEFTGKNAVNAMISPWIMEMYYDLEKRGYGKEIGWRFNSVFEGFLNSPNVHMQGVGLRLHALNAFSEGEKIERVLDYLSESERLLELSGDPVQLAKTHIELARLKLRLGKRKESFYLAMNARKGIAGYCEDVFPDELKEVLGNVSPTISPLSPDEQMDRIFSLFEEMGSAVTGQFHEVMLSAMNRFFRAERSALFRFRSEIAHPEIVAAHHLTEADIASAGFEYSMSLVYRAFQENRPIIDRSGGEPIADGRKRLSVLCLPFKGESETVGVLYHDNVYLKDGFDIAEELLMRMSRLVSEYIRQNRKYQQKIKAEQSILKKSFRRRDYGDEFIFPTPGLMELIKIGRKVAASDAPVLITGETGTGKEVLAHWIHEQSSRSDNPFIVLEPTAIPETLIESDLFGHEKGAFTGADRQKIGRIELAHTGTLFIDEIGEIPENVQIKLLRVLEEKRITRLGGCRNIHSDFRLVAATNRNLIDEIKKGRFREDLYYRLNVIEMTMPPLRNRKTDIGILAQHFLRRCARKYNRGHLSLTENDKNRLEMFDWPGNVRELRNVIERAVLLSTGETLELTLPSEFGKSRNRHRKEWPSMDEMQRRYILFIHLFCM